MEQSLHSLEKEIKTEWLHCKDFPEKVSLLLKLHEQLQTGLKTKGSQLTAALEDVSKYSDSSDYFFEID